MYVKINKKFKLILYYIISKLNANFKGKHGKKRFSITIQ